MAFDLGTLIRAAALGGTAFAQSKADRAEQERKRQEEEDTKRADLRQRALDETEQILRMQALRAREADRTAPPTPPGYKFNKGGVSGEAATIEDALAALAQIPNPPEKPQAPKAPVTRMIEGKLYERSPSGTWQPAQIEGGGAAAGGGSSLADLARAGLQVGEESSRVHGRLNPFVANQRIRAEPDVDTQNVIEEITRRNDIRRELIAAGWTDKDEIEAEVERRISGGS